MRHGALTKKILTLAILLTSIVMIAVPAAASPCSEYCYYQLFRPCFTGCDADYDSCLEHDIQQTCASARDQCYAQCQASYYDCLYSCE